MKTPGLWIFFGCMASWLMAGTSNGTELDTIQESFKQGNYKVTYEQAQAFLRQPSANPALPGDALRVGVQCLRSLGRSDEIDAFRDEVIKTHQANWQLLVSAAQTIQEDEKFGSVIAGTFHRGHQRGEGKPVNCFERDRVRALQLLVQALPLANADANKPLVARQFYLTLAGTVLGQRSNSDSWRLQVATDLTELPDYEEGWYWPQRQSAAPVDAEGNPISYQVPRSWKQAASDGERWRWALSQAVELDPGLLNQTRLERARFALSQFGENTLGDFRPWRGRDEQESSQSRLDSLDKLTDDEALARLASGIKRFPFPKDSNYIQLFRQIADEPKTGFAEAALEELAQIYENRRQFPRAAAIWRELIKAYGTGTNQHRQERLDQIVKNWCRFEPARTQPVGTGGTLDLRFRNGQEITFTAQEVLVDKLLEEVKTYLRSRPGQFEWQRIDLNNIGYRIVNENQTQFLGAQVAQWQLKADPAKDHFDRHVTVTTPLQKGGAYLVTARMKDGNESSIILWISDLAIVKKNLDQQTLYYIADSVNGAPIAKANVELFGWRNQHIKNNEFRLDTKQFALLSDEQGMAIASPQDQPAEFQWLITARSGERRAFIGFSGVWYQSGYDQAYNQTKVFVMTDRPVYRPAQKVQFKLWIRKAQYDQPDTSDFANQDFDVDITNPRGEKVFTKRYHTDAFGGITGEYEVPANAVLGNYQIQIPNYEGGSFRIEEYRKPEYEVTVTAPTDPIELGEKVTATIAAKYYFGSPVTEARVRYKVTRTSYTGTWYPWGIWDWFYGRGYWWFACDTPWYPGWRFWGCERPLCCWWPMPQPQPEVVLESEARIGADGTFKLEIDTALAKLVHPDQDHKYAIVAEVMDQSRRTIVGQGEVLVARRPFRVYCWLDHGYYRQGDTIQARFHAQRLDGAAVSGKGTATLYSIRYDQEGNPIEKRAESWDVEADAQGEASLKVTAAAPGQYRLSLLLTDAQGHQVEGGYLYTVVGQQLTSESARFNDLEMIPDKREFAPGEKVKLLINTNLSDSSVLLFLRPTNGVYLKPKLLHLDGKSTTQEIEVTLKDMPNFFVEAVTIANGRAFSEVRQLVVPPEKRIVNVEVTPKTTPLKPAESTQVRLKLTDLEGKPLVGSTVISVYDKSVEAIAGGSNVPDIKAHFWKWLRQHYPQQEVSLERGSYQLIKQGAASMNDIGMFGHAVRGKALGKFRGGSENFFSHSEDRDAAAPMAAPMSAVPNMMAADNLALAEAKAPGAGAEGEGAPLVEPTVRTEFADTALWSTEVTTGPDGIAEIPLKMPENLTTWKIRVWSMGHGTKVGQGEAEVITRKDLLVRLQTPRFAVQNDTVTLTANVHNYLAAKKEVTVKWQLPGTCLASGSDAALSSKLTIDAGGEGRVDLPVQVKTSGQAKVQVQALTDQESDAMELSFPCLVHGLLRTEAWAGTVSADQEKSQLTIQVPAERRPEQSRLEIRYSPSLAAALVDALPYLVHHPNDSSDLNLDRFLPTVIVQKILLDLKLDLPAIRDKRANLNAQELGDAQQRAKQWKRFDRDPVFDVDQVRELSKQGVQKLVDMQLSDGGWGWFYGSGEYASPHLTAYVLHGLQQAAANDVAVPTSVLERGRDWLARYQQEQIRLLVATAPAPHKSTCDHLDALVYFTLVESGVKDDQMRDFLYRDRLHLSVYAQAMLGLALHAVQDQEKLSMVLQNLEQYLVQDAENETAYLRLPEGNWWWFWYGDDVEANAFYLRLLVRTQPKSPVAPRLVKYLLNNRKHGTYWQSSRQTAQAIEALAEYLKASGELEPNLTVEILVDGKSRHQVKITPQNLFSIDPSFVLEKEALTSGDHAIEIRRTGKGPLYWNVYSTNFTLAEPIEHAGLELRVNRKFYRLVPAKKNVATAGSRGQVVEARVEKFDRVEMNAQSSVACGELVEVELEIDSKNDYEYLMFADSKAAGLEPVEQRSGYSGNALGAYMELRDDRVTFFVRQLPRGKSSLSYRLRAETPGKFAALPTVGEGVYAPEIKGNSDELRLQVKD